MIVIKDLSRKAETLILNALCNFPEVIHVLPDNTNSNTKLCIVILLRTFHASNSN